MRQGLAIVGGIAFLVGLVWVGQGLGYIKGSFMTGDMKWFWIGVVTGVLGLVVGIGAVATARRRPTGSGAGPT